PDDGDEGKDCLFPADPVDRPAAYAHLLKRLDDDDLRVATRALLSFQKDSSEWIEPALVFDALERMKARVKKRTTKLDALVWPWWEVKVEKSAIAASMSAHATNSKLSGRMLDHIGDLDPWGRESFVRELASLPYRWRRRSASRKVKKLEGAARDAVIAMLGDASPDVRGAAFEAMTKTPVTDAEIDKLVALSSRKTGDLRNRILARLAQLSKKKQLGVAERLLQDKNGLRRRAGLELLHDGFTSGRFPERARELVEQYRADRPELEKEELIHVESVCGGQVEDTPVRDDAFGLIDPSRLPSWPDPKARRIELESKAASQCLESLSEILLRHRDHEVETESYGTRTLLEISSAPGRKDSMSAEERANLLPLVDIWREWEASRGAKMRDADDLELLRARFADADEPIWRGEFTSRLNPKRSRWSSIPSAVYLVREILEACLHWQRPDGVFDFLLDAYEDTLASLSSKEWAKVASVDRYSWTSCRTNALEIKVGEAFDRRGWLERARGVLEDRPAGSHSVREYALVKRSLQLSSGSEHFAPDLKDFARAHSANGFAESGPEELIDLLIGSSAVHGYASELGDATSRKPPKELAGHDDLVAATDRVRRRLVEIECSRGDRTTEASRFC
ncbi:MAG: hypothetical protein AAF517_11530, partial [Planctomycetota bacterium]